jgi:hypothetical protein
MAVRGPSSGPRKHTSSTLPSCAASKHVCGVKPAIHVCCHLWRRRGRLLV